MPPRHQQTAPQKGTTIWAESKDMAMVIVNQTVETDMFKVTVTNMGQTLFLLSFFGRMRGEGQREMEEEGRNVMEMEEVEEPRLGRKLGMLVATRVWNTTPGI